MTDRGSQRDRPLFDTRTFRRNISANEKDNGVILRKQKKTEKRNENRTKRTAHTFEKEKKRRKSRLSDPIHSRALPLSSRRRCTKYLIPESSENSPGNTFVSPPSKPTPLEKGKGLPIWSSSRARSHSCKGAIMRRDERTTH